LVHSPHMSGSTKQVLAYVALAVVLLASGGLAYGAVSGGGGGTRSNSRTVTVQRGSISQTVSGTGNLEPASPVDVNFQTSGTITEIDVTTGEQVTSGEVLAKLDPSAAQTALDVAKLNLSAANTKLSQAKSGASSGGQSSGGGSSSGVSQAQLHADQVALSDAQQSAQTNAQGYQLNVDQAQSQLDSDKQQQTTDCNADPSSTACADDNHTVEQDQNALATAKQNQAEGLQHDQEAIHNAQAKVDIDQASIDAARAAASAPTGTVDAAAVATAQAGVLQAQSSVVAAQKALDATTLVAPADGTVSSITKNVGDSVSSGSSSSSSSSSSSPSGGNGGNGGNGSSNSSNSSSSSTAAFTIVDPTAFEVKVGLPESDAIKVKPGQQASTTLDALTGTTLTGTVTSIDDTATVTSNVVTYNALVSVTNPPADAKSGMTANVTITTLSKDNVLEVATAAVQTQAGNSYVNKLVNGRVVQTDVTTGLQGDSNTEIVSGLSQGDQVVVNTGTVSSTSGTRTSGGNGTFGGGGGGFQGGGAFPGGGPN
jgi:multidrug efflux pump subunit AcrA (membrane-fusion protein)